jgi:hypothetical protein
MEQLLAVLKSDRRAAQAINASTANVRMAGTLSLANVVKTSPEMFAKNAFNRRGDSQAMVLSPSIHF